jgi:DNA-binding IclR family transcriptional regulator
MGLRLTMDCSWSMFRLVCRSWRRLTHRKIVRTYEQSPPMSQRPRSVVKSADRVLDIFEVLAQKSRPLSHAELGAELGIPKSSLSQLLANLVERTYLRFDGARGTYELGDGFNRLIDRRSRMASLADLAQPLCERITKITGESSSLNLRRDLYVERVCGANSSHALTFSMKIGELAPMYAVSSGKVLLATLNDRELDVYLSAVKLEAITKHTLVSPSKLRKELSVIKKTGVAWSFEEFTPGIVGVAVAAYVGAEPIGALNIALPKVRDTEQHRQALVAALRSAAASLEKDLLATKAPPPS